MSFLFAGGLYNTKVDVYMFGIVLWELIARQIPFDVLSYVEIREQTTSGARPHIPLSTPGYLANLLRACWHQDPDERPVSQVILERLGSAR